MHGVKERIKCIPLELKLLSIRCGAEMKDLLEYLQAPFHMMRVLSDS